MYATLERKILSHLIQNLSQKEIKKDCRVLVAHLPSITMPHSYVAVGTQASDSIESVRQADVIVSSIFSELIILEKSSSRIFKTAAGLRPSALGPSSFIKRYDFFIL